MSGIRWEYRQVKDIQYGEIRDSVAQLDTPTLNALGAEGWELVTILRDLTYIFKRRAK